MKNIFYLIALFLIFSCGQKEKETFFKVEGKAPAEAEKMVLMWNNGMLRPVQTVGVDSTGRYKFQYDVENPGKYVVADGKFRYNVEVYALPGDHLGVDFIGDEIQYSGDEAENNRFMVGMKKYMSEVRQKHPAQMENIENYQQAITKQTNEILGFILRSDLKDKDFVGLLIAEQQKNRLQALLNYPDFYRMVVGKEAVLPAGYYDFLKEVDLSSPYMKNLGDVNFFLRDLFNAMETQGYLSTGLEDYLVRRGELIKDPSLRENYYLFALELELYGFNQQYSQLITSVASQITSEKNKQKLIELQSKYNEGLTKNSSFMAGNPAFNFIGMDAMGKQHALADLKGKVVVVDVWNTGCKPCIAEIPYMKKVEKEFEGEEVVFISYSLDTDREQWLSFIKGRQMGGNQWIDTAGFKSDLVKAFDLHGIPRFMLFDKQGNIADVFAPRPSDPKLSMKIEKLLQ